MGPPTIDAAPHIGLKRAGVPPQQLLHFYTAVIPPVLEYASPVWHYASNHTQSQH